VDFSIIIYGLLIGFFASIPLGPMGFIVIQKTLIKDFRAGIVSGIGIALGDTFFSLIASVGLNFIYNLISEYRLFFRLLGSIIMFAIGLKIFFTNVIKQRYESSIGIKKSSIEILKMFMLTILNPLIILVFGAIFAALGIFNKLNSFFDLIFFNVGFCIGGFTWWLLLSFLIFKFRKKIRIRQLWWLNRIMGIIVIVIGIFYLLLSILEVLKFNFS